MRRRKNGFTVIEMCIVAGLAAVVAYIAYTPVVNGMIMTQRERTLMSMFATGDAVTTRLTTLLQPAVIPAIAPNRGNPLAGVGDRWTDVLRAGTDFLPFCTPVPARRNPPDPNNPAADTGNPVDGNGNPVLGIVRPGGTVTGSWDDPTSTWVVSNISSLISRPSRIGDGVHSDLAALNPGFFGFSDSLPTTIDTTEARFADRLVFPPTGRRGYAVIRFVPDRLGGGPQTLDEAAMGLDLDGDGNQNDSFLRGRLVLEYANTGIQSEETRNVQFEFPLSGQSVLLQLNTTDDETYAPIFQLAEDNRGEVVRHALRVRLLLFDEVGQRSTPMATGGIGGRQFLTRRVETTIEMRNMIF